MTLVTDLIILAVLVYSAFSGAKRGFVLIGLELVCFTIATLAAFWLYHPVGSLIKGLAGTTLALSNVTGFAVVWILTEVVCAVVIRFAVLPHLTRQVQLSRPNQVGGGALNVLKSAAIVSLLLMIVANLPVPSGYKNVVTGSLLAKLLAVPTDRLQTSLGLDLSRDLGESLNFFTITSEPESEQRVELGYTTSGPADPTAEASMLGLINQERTSRGLKALTANPKARDVARKHSVDMFGHGYFSHLNLAGKTPFDRMEAGGVKFDAAGENLALAPTLLLAHEGLMNSPGHRANILSKDYKTVGIGIIDGGQYGLMVTQDFTD